MKKYIAPAVEIHLTETFQMMALSLVDEMADGGTVLSVEPELNVLDEVEE